MRHPVFRRRRFIPLLLLLPLLSVGPLPLVGCGSGNGTRANPDPTARRVLVQGIVLMHEEGTPRQNASPDRDLGGALPGFPFPGTTIVVRKLNCTGPGELDGCSIAGEATRLKPPGSLFEVWLPPGKYSFKGLPADPSRYSSDVRALIEKSKPISTDVVVSDDGASIYLFYDYPPMPPAPPLSSP
jgi:hypothetical protein